MEPFRLSTSFLTGTVVGYTDVFSASRCFLVGTSNRHIGRELQLVQLNAKGRRLLILLLLQALPLRAA